ncbi:MAG: peptidylprolyl isomerase [Candidatus Bipolaricaulota bacterium]|nr:peptidylprolyl isomerase [Candidatus Bipolaricaulota bacterium]MCS7274463.1 peptidylprolyl isomerase [Candidatus Bipolaricaulota bacterium]MDW8110892.1 peptidylprolyl isomerase [Candidatus Bipolaricaulota bacterium]
MKHSRFWGLLLLAVVFFLSGCGQRPPQPAPQSPAETEKREPAPPPPAATSKPAEPSPVASPPPMTKNPIAIVETSLGIFKIELFLDKAPITAQNFIDLVKRDFYKEMIFHRVVANFVIQTGDPTGTGRGGSDKTIPLEIHPELRHDSAGVVGMARGPDPNSASSQFYITLRATPHLDGRYAVFGKVIEGLDVVMKIGEVEVGPGDRPVIPVELKAITLQQ